MTERRKIGSTLIEKMLLIALLGIVLTVAISMLGGG